MKIEGANEIPASQDKVWAAFLDPATLARAIPGCEGLEEIGPGEYKAVMKVGVAAIKGTFEGKVKLMDLEPPNRYRMSVEGKGGPGFVKGEATMSLSAVSPLTCLSICNTTKPLTERIGSQMSPSLPPNAASSTCRPNGQKRVSLTLPSSSTVLPWP